MPDTYNFRLVVLGAGRVGKTSIISRILYNSFPDKYVETVEDLHNREFRFAGLNYQISILDTAGELQFPAMRRLSIMNAHGFMLVYEVTEPKSLQLLKGIIDEIKSERGPLVSNVPAVLVGNKIDQEIWHEILKEDVQAYLRREALDWPVIEVSAKKDLNIGYIASSLLSQWRRFSSDYKDSAGDLSGSGTGHGSSNSLGDPSSELRLFRTASVKMTGEASASQSQLFKPSEKTSAVRSISMYGRRLSTNFHRPKKPSYQSGSEELSESTGNIAADAVDSCKLM